MTEGRLLSTGEAADALEIDRTTLARWARAGRVTPASKTIGGYLRWDLAKLRTELEAAGAITPSRESD
ncbi:MULTISPECIES: helix-turn-helix domain-containing protein [unclassified Pseudonocardia]|uniref:helix-turn-helix domain-containing protein n=1 Tax=unclassified Pseudonocardia TaxID=2619320 RepID=UPI00094B741C